MNIWPFKKRKVYVKFGGQRIEVRPLSLVNVIELILLMSPYLPLLEEYLPQLKQAANGYAKKRPQLLSQIFYILRDEMKDTPGDIVKAVALLAGVDPTWLAQVATAGELLGALPVLDRAHNFGRLWQVVQEGGVHIRFDLG